MKALHITGLVVGVFLLLGTESMDAMTNILGLLLVVYGCEKLNLWDSKDKEADKTRCQEQ